MVVNTRSFNFGLAQLLQKFSKAVTVASVAVIHEFKSGVLEARSAKEMPTYFASGMLLRKVPSSKCVRGRNSRSAP